MSYIDSHGNTKDPSPCGPGCGCGATPTSLNVPITGGIAFGEKLLIRKEPVALDGWEHRSSGMRCGTCMWFVAKAVLPGPRPPQPRGPLGRCRRHAPTLSGYPAVFGTDWCGDHKLDEEKSNG